MHQLEAHSQALGVSPAILMKNAGHGIAKSVLKEIGDVKDLQITVLVGPGNNGGDGLIAAEYFHSWKARVTIYLCGKPTQVHNDVINAYQTPLIIKNISDSKNIADFIHTLKTSDLVIDSILGTGKSRPITGILKDILEALAEAKNSRTDMYIVAVDLPTGINADTGETDPVSISADLTLPLGNPKIGMYEFPAAHKTGKIDVVDIGIPIEAETGSNVELITPSHVSNYLPERPLFAHKGSFGKVLVVAGSSEYIGAAYLASSAAARTGAGVVALAIPQSLQMSIAAQSMESTYIPLPEISPGVVSPSAAEIILKNIPNYDSLLIGCGMGQNDSTREMLKILLYSKGVMPPTIIDADGLNFLSTTQSPQWWERIPGELIVTPHLGEMSRLSGIGINEIQKNRLSCAVGSAKKWNKITVLKGAYTIVASPNGNSMLSPFVNPGLATGGTGDVLAGTIAGFLAQGVGLENGAAIGVYIHGSAGEIVKKTLGDTGMLASDLLPALPRAIKNLKSL